MDDDDDEVVAALRRAGCVFAEEEAALLRAHAVGTGARLDDLVRRRSAGEPLEYVVGSALFCGLRIAVAPGVFVPRRRSEALAALAVGYVEQRGSTPTVLDLCCGAGAIGAAVLAAVPGAVLHASDIDPTATDCARRNLRSSAHVYTGDLFAPLPERLRGRIDIVVANAPYVPTEDIALLPAEAREYERRTALDGGTDGLAIARRIVDEAPQWLAPGGTVLVETSAAQAAGLAAAVAAAGLLPRIHTDEEHEHTAVLGTARA